MTPRQRFADLAGEAHLALARLAETGYPGVDLSEASLAKIHRWGRGPAPASRKKGPADPVADRCPKRTGGREDIPARGGAAETLATIRADLGDCRRCKLAAGRTNIVFGAGSPRAQLVFVGEGPGSREDAQGLPFVGAAGELLTKIIQAMTLSRDSVYICNIIKCRPPGNRNPEPDETGACIPFLHRQINAIAPAFICCLGSVAARALLETDQPISRLRGRFHRVWGIPVMPTFHPAYLLRNPQRKREVWNDMKQLMHAMGMTPP
jgi:uracil-DNA glycosylase